MNLFGDAALGKGYTSPSQQARLISEGWITRFGYCLNCESDELSPTIPNTRTRDFSCSRCDYSYELKAKCGTFSTQVLDGAYKAMMNTIRSGTTPTFLLMEYTRSWSIIGLRALHRSLITEPTIKPRKALAHTARRAGWIGCSIVLPAIALEGQISLVRDGEPQSKNASREAFARLENLSRLSLDNRRWAASVLNILSRIKSGTFTLEEVYEFTPEFQRLYPNNKNVQAKLRQQLQVLRDAGLIRFLGGGHYEFVNNN